MDLSENKTTTLLCKRKLITIDQPQVMGILNTTPDSFYAKSRKEDEQGLLHAAENMLAEGAHWLDIGGYSSRPGAQHITIEEELNRVLPAVKTLLHHFPEVKISIDTFRHPIAEQALDAGAMMVNDISGGLLDENMMETVAKYRVPYVMMHIKGNPQSMQSETNYTNLLAEVYQQLAVQKHKAQAAGIHDIILDVGFGFGKTLEQNFEIAQNLSYFESLNCPILVGISRKSMLYKLCNITPEESLPATTAMHLHLLQQGAQFLRVHDVKEAHQAIKINKALSI